MNHGCEDLPDGRVVSGIHDLAERRMVVSVILSVADDVDWSAM